MKQGRLNNLTIMSMEWDLMRGVDFSDVINDFENKKVKKNLGVLILLLNRYYCFQRFMYSFRKIKNATFRF